MIEESTEVVFNKGVARNTFFMGFRSDPMANESRPGQFVMMQVRSGIDPLLRRPFSILGVNGDVLLILYQVVGRGTAILSEKKPGDFLRVLGPLGKGFAPPGEAVQPILVAGGMGIAPLTYLAQEAVGQGKAVRLLYGTPAAERCLVPDGAGEIAATEDGSVGHCGLVTDLIPQHADWADQAFACGPPAMCRDMARRREELGLAGKAAQVSLEMRMGCGRGVCYSCTVKTKAGLKQVCKDGPVLDMDDVIWEDLGRA